MKNFIHLFIAVLLTTNSCTLSKYQLENHSHAKEHERNYDMPKKPGKCYAKCIQPTTYDIIQLTYYKYTGSPSISDYAHTKDQEIIIKPAMNKWVKKRADKKCLSSNPDDCLVWCLVNEPQESITMRVVVDTTLTKKFKSETINEKTIISEGGFKVWEEVVCVSQISPELTTDIKMALTAQNYYKGEINGVMDAAFKVSLQQFQLDNQIATGGITLKSIQLLGIENY